MSELEKRKKIKTLQRLIEHEKNVRVDRRYIFEIWDKNSANLIAQYEKELKQAEGEIMPPIWEQAGMTFFEFRALPEPEKKKLLIKHRGFKIFTEEELTDIRAKLKNPSETLLKAWYRDDPRRFRKAKHWAMGHARNYARANKIEMAVTWIERAAQFEPLTSMELWRIQKIIGPYKFTELNLDRFSKEKWHLSNEAARS